AARELFVFEFQLLWDPREDRDLVPALERRSARERPGTLRAAQNQNAHRLPTWFARALTSSLAVKVCSSTAKATLVSTTQSVARCVHLHPTHKSHCYPRILMCLEGSNP